jgi:hypothetical protein
MSGYTWSRGAQCAWCHKPLRESHPPYLITKDNQIHGPYHIECVDSATFKLDPDAWKRRHAYAARRTPPFEPRE